jgi:hypothetical protein
MRFIASLPVKPPVSRDGTQQPSRSSRQVPLHRAPAPRAEPRLAEDIGLLRRELFVGQHAGLVELGQLLELRDRLVGETFGRGLGRRRCSRSRSRSRRLRPYGDALDIFAALVDEIVARARQTTGKQSLRPGAGKRSRGTAFRVNPLCARPGPPRQHAVRLVEHPMIAVHSCEGACRRRAQGREHLMEPLAVGATPVLPYPPPRGHPRSPPSAGPQLVEAPVCSRARVAITPEHDPGERLNRAVRRDVLLPSLFDQRELAGECCLKLFRGVARHG